MGDGPYAERVGEVVNWRATRNVLLATAIVLGAVAYVDHKGDVAECAAKGQRRALFGCVDR